MILLLFLFGILCAAATQDYGVDIALYHPYQKYVGLSLSFTMPLFTMPLITMPLLAMPFLYAHDEFSSTTALTIGDKGPTTGYDPDLRAYSV